MVSLIRKCRAMTPRLKKLILVLAAFPVMLMYIGAMVWLADKVPGHWLAQLVFYIVAGTVWAFPLKPVFGWANSTPRA